MSIWGGKPAEPLSAETFKKLRASMQASIDAPLSVQPTEYWCTDVEIARTVLASGGRVLCPVRVAEELEKD